MKAFFMLGQVLYHRAAKASFSCNRVALGVKFDLVPPSFKAWPLMDCVIIVLNDSYLGGAMFYVP